MDRGEARCVCIEDHALVGDWLEGCLHDAGFGLVKRIISADRVIETVDEIGAQLVMTDVMLPSGDPFGAIEDLRRRRSHVRVLFLSASTSLANIQSALKAGASGYLGKADSPESIVAGIRSVMRGRFAFGESVMEAWPALRQYHDKPMTPNIDVEIEDTSRIGQLTTRELEVLRLMGQGMQRSAIAEALHRSPKTVDKHRAAIMRKLDIHDRAEIVLYAVREGIVSAR